MFAPLGRIVQLGGATIGEREMIEHRTHPSAPGALVGIACPTCGSDNVRAFSLVHAEGRHTSILRGGAIGESGGHLAYGSFAGRSRGQSDLSKSVAPPTHRSATGSNVTYKQAPRVRRKTAEQHDVFDQDAS